MKNIFTLLLLILWQFSALAQRSISIKNLQKDIDYLASDKLEGRGVGEAGCEKAAKYLAKQFKKIGLKPKGTEGGWFQPFEFQLSKNPHGIVDTNAQKIKSQNVIGFLDNGAAHTIVVGAHYDHLGKGFLGSSLEANSSGQIHNGADDNASGTAGVLELARYFVNNDKKEPFNFLFICFSAEEEGLIGSKRFCENPTIPLSSVNYMLNMDMIGRLQADRGLLVQGVGTSPLWMPMIGVVKKEGLTIKTDSAGIGPSDYTSFYLKNIPVIGLFTGGHSDYHKPSDDADKINYEGTKQVLEYAVRLIEGTCTFDKLAFQETKPQPSRESRAFKVTMGVMPDYAADVKGMRIDGVTKGKPAEKAGLQKGDIITKIGDNSIADVYQYMDALNKFKKGESTKITIVRDGKELVLDITF